MLGILRTAPVYPRSLDYRIMLLIAGVSLFSGFEILSFGDCFLLSSKADVSQSSVLGPPSPHHIAVMGNPNHFVVPWLSFTCNMCIRIPPSPVSVAQTFLLSFRTAETLRCLAGACRREWGRVVSTLFGVGLHESVNKLITNYQPTILVRYFSVESHKYMEFF